MIDEIDEEKVSIIIPFILIMLVLGCLFFAIGMVVGKETSEAHVCYICQQPSVCEIKSADKSIKLCADCARPHFQYLQQIEEQ